MPRLLQTLAFCFWCVLLLDGPAVADEEAHLGPNPSSKDPPETKQCYSYWCRASSSLSSLLYNPFSRSVEEAPALTTTAKGLTEPIDILQDHSGSGDESISEGSKTPQKWTQGLVSSVTEIITESLPTETSDSRRIPPSDNGTLVFNSPTSGSIRNTVFTNTPTSTGTPGQNATQIPRATARIAGPSVGATTQHLPKEHTIVDEDSSEKRSLTVFQETTVPTALTGAAETTTTTPGLVETTLTSLGPWDPSETTFPTALTWAAETTTTTPGLVETMLTNGQNLGPWVPSETPFPKTQQDSTVGITEATVNTHPTQSEAYLGVSQARSGPLEEQPGGSTTTATGIDVPESITSTTQRVSVPIAGELPGKEDKEAEDGAVPTADGDGVSTATAKPLTASQPTSTEPPPIPPHTEDWMLHPAVSDSTLLPDCNKERSGICNVSDPWEVTASVSPAPNTTNTNTNTNQSSTPFLVPAPPMLVPLYTDWNSAMASWGLAWDAHVYGAGCIFAMLTLASALNLLCLPLRCPSGCGYFALVSLFLLAAGCTRSFSLLYDAYGHQDRLTSPEAALILYEAPFPCLTAAFGLVFLLLSMRSRMQLSYSAFQRPCFLACLVVAHFGAAFGPVTLLKFYQQKPPLCLFLSLISRGAFVALATFLSAAYFVFYIYVRADSKHIYHLNNTSPTPAERYNRCPFAESRDWDRAAVTVCISALFCLACAGLQLYAMLNAMGVAGGEEVFHPWPWWAFQFSCRLCELGVCLTLALVVAQPVYCSDHLPAAGNCWTELLASKSSILPGSYQWSLSQQEKLAIVDTVGLGETESLPLYTLVDERLGSSLNGLDLLYHSNRALAYRDLDLDLDSRKPEDGGGGEPSGGSSFTSDSTADLRPPSPINLRRSIDEALFSEALFPMSLFSPTRPLRCSDLSINNHCSLPCNGTCEDKDPGLYRTSSCVEMATKTTQSQGDTIEGAPPSPSLSTTSSCSSPERWRGSSSSCSLYRESLRGSSLVLCPSPERHALQLLQQGCGGHQGHQGDPQRHYHTLGAPSQESLDLDMSSEADRSVQEEFISVCRQIDALSICSETIDL